MSGDLFKPEDLLIQVDEELAHLLEAEAHEVWLGMCEDERERCRYHEAGHVAVCLALGFPVLKARAEFGGCVRITTLPTDNALALRLYGAGAAAEMRMPGADGSIPQPRLDIEMASRLLGSDKTWEDVVAEADRWVSANWAIVEWTVGAFRRDGEYLSEVTLAHLNECVAQRSKGDVA